MEDADFICWLENEEAGQQLIQEGKMQILSDSLGKFCQGPNSICLIKKVLPSPYNPQEPKVQILSASLGSFVSASL